MFRVPRVTPPRHCNWGHMSTSSRVIPSKYCTWGYMSGFSLVTPSQTMNLGPDIDSLQDDPNTSELVTGFTFPVSYMTPDQTHRLWVHSPHSPGRHPPRSCNWGNTSTISRVTTPPRTCMWDTLQQYPERHHFSDPAPGLACLQAPRYLTLDPWSHVHSPQADPTSQNCTWGHISTVSRVILLPRPFTWGHMSKVSRLTPTPQTLHLWSQVHSIQGNSTSYTLYLDSHIHSLHGEPHPDQAPIITYPLSPG